MRKTQPVTGSNNPAFIADAVNELFIYRTPKKIIDWIKKEYLKSIIGNPPYKTNP